MSKLTTKMVEVNGDNRASARGHHVFIVVEAGQSSKGLDWAAVRRNVAATGGYLSLALIDGSRSNWVVRPTPIADQIPMHAPTVSAGAAAPGIAAAIIDQVMEAQGLVPAIQTTEVRLYGGGLVETELNDALGGEKTVQLRVFDKSGLRAARSTHKPPTATPTKPATRTAGHTAPSNPNAGKATATSTSLPPAYKPLQKASKTTQPPPKPNLGMAIGSLIGIFAVVGLIVWQIATHTTADTGGTSSGTSTTSVEGSVVPGTTAPPACTSVGATVSASSTAPDGIDSLSRTITYSPGNLIDGDTTTAWRTPGDGVGETITVRFSQVCRLTSLQVVNGYSKIDPGDNTDRWPQNRRVRLFSITTDRQFDVALDPNERGWQSLSITPSNVEVIQLEIRASAPSTTERDFTAISEIRVR